MVMLLFRTLRDVIAGHHRANRHRRRAIVHRRHRRRAIVRRRRR